MSTDLTDYKITVNDEVVEVAANDWDTLDMLQVDDSNFHLLQNNRAYKIQVLRSHFGDKTIEVAVNGNPYKVRIKDAYDQMIKAMGLLNGTSQKINEIKAPMPGLILDILIKEGQEISEGTPLLILSAMKMENIILSQGNGIVKSIKVNIDDAVEKGQLIIEME